MKILLDECMPRQLRRHLEEHEVFTVSYLHWNGLRNGALMTRAVENEFDLLLTNDKNLSFQQNLKNFDLCVVAFDTKSGNLEDFLIFIPIFLVRLPEFQKGQAYLLELE